MVMYLVYPRIGDHDGRLREMFFRLGFPLQYNGSRV
jgi:hypothetical protein